MTHSKPDSYYFKDIDIKVGNMMLKMNIHVYLSTVTNSDNNMLLKCLREEMTELTSVADLCSKSHGVHCTVSE